jgi:hypothetical protein
MATLHLKKHMPPLAKPPNITKLNNSRTLTTSPSTHNPSPYPTYPTRPSSPAPHLPPHTPNSPTHPTRNCTTYPPRRPPCHRPSARHAPKCRNAPHLSHPRPTPATPPPPDLLALEASLERASCLTLQN